MQAVTGYKGWCRKGCTKSYRGVLRAIDLKDLEAEDVEQSDAERALLILAAGCRAATCFRLGTRERLVDPVNVLLL